MDRGNVVYGDLERVDVIFDSFDALPPELRQFIHEAQMPWDHRPIADLYDQAIEAGHPVPLVIANLHRLDRDRMSKECLKTYGRNHPEAARPSFLGNWS